MKKKHAIKIGTTTCSKCGSDECEIRKHSFIPKKTKYYFTQWDYCEKCKHLQHYEKYKRVKDTRGVYRITKYSDSWLSAYRQR